MKSNKELMNYINTVVREAGTKEGYFPLTSRVGVETYDKDQRISKTVDLLLVNNKGNTSVTDSSLGEAKSITKLNRHTLYKIIHSIDQTFYDISHTPETAIPLRDSIIASYKEQHKDINL